MDRVQRAMAKQFPDIRTFFSSGSMVDAILNTGMPAPIDVQVSSPDLDQIYGIAQNLATQIREVQGVGQVYIPQDMNYPALRLDVDRVHAGELGLTQKDVVDNVITALNSNYMIAPNYWVDRKSGNDYYLTVQFFEQGNAAIHNMADLGQIPLRDPGNGGGMNCGPTGPPQPGTGHASWACGGQGRPITVLKNVVNVKQIQTPTEVDHYQIQRAMDVYVTPAGEDLGRVTEFAFATFWRRPKFPATCA